MTVNHYLPTCFVNVNVVVIVTEKVVAIVIEKVTSTAYLARDHLEESFLEFVSLS